MGNYKLSKTSVGRLDGVHPDLVDVVYHALEISNIDFGVAEGIRTVEKQKQYVVEGKSKTMNSRHIPKYVPELEDHYGHAVDLYAYADGRALWDIESLSIVNEAMQAAASELGIDIEWGGYWKTFLDCPHYQLKW